MILRYVIQYTSQDGLEITFTIILMDFTNYVYNYIINVSLTHATASASIFHWKYSLKVKLSNRKLSNSTCTNSNLKSYY